MLDFINYSTKLKNYYDSSKLVIGKMKDKTSRAAMKGFIGLKQKMYLFLIDDNGEQKKPKRMNRNFVAIICHNEYKYVLLNNKFLRHLMNIIQSKDHKIGTYKINKNPSYYFDDKIYIKSNGYHGLAFGY